MALSVHVLQAIGVNALLDEVREVSLILGRIFLLEHLHVLLQVAAEDSLLVCLGVVLALLVLAVRRLVAREILRVVWHMETTIGSALQDTLLVCLGVVLA